MTAEILRLRCVRCGDWHEREVGDPYLPELCSPCFSKMLEAANAHRDYATGLDCFIMRFRRGTERHPTMLALEKAWAEYTKEWPKDDASPF